MMVILAVVAEEATMDVLVWAVPVGEEAVTFVPLVRVFPEAH